MNHWNTHHLTDVKPTPWRNGAGLTRELVVWPAQGDWRWRMSVADVVAGGPFSRFEGITRWFAVLTGSGVVLNIRHQPAKTQTQPDKCREHRLTPAAAPLCFDGGDATDCQLIQGPTQDFNLMLHADCQPALMLRVNGQLMQRVPAGKTIAVYAIDAAASVQWDAEPADDEPVNREHVGSEQTRDLRFEVPANTLCWRVLNQAATVRVKAVNALWMELTT